MDLTGRGTTRNVVINKDDILTIFIKNGRRVMVREERGHLFFNRLDKHDQPLYPTLELK